MEPQENVSQEDSFFSKIRKFIRAHEKIAVIVSFLVIIITLYIVNLYFPTKAKEEKQVSITPQPTNNQAIKKEKGNNPLITNSELERVQNAYKKKLEKIGQKMPETPKYQFQYELSPQLKTKSSLLPVKSVFAANICNIDTAPEKLSVYTLKSHLFQDEAVSIAKEFGLNVPPASLPMDDGVSFQYYFADSQTSSFLTISEPSGAYTYHRAIKTDPTGAADINLSKAKDTSDQELAKHNLFTNSKIANQKLDNGLDKYVIDYIKDYDGLKMVDLNTIKDLGQTKSACGVAATVSMNNIQTIITKKGELFKIVNKTRKIGKTYTFNRQKLENSVNEYGANPPIAPIVIGSAGGLPGEKIIIDEAVLVWFDYGEQYAQISYVPMYLASGKTASGDRVLTLFPAISKADLDKTEINDLGDSQLTLQLSTFKPQPPKPVKLPSAPGGCYGNLIDYTVSCTSTRTGGNICGAFLEAKAENDPFGVCDNGCQNKSETFTVSAGTDPCKKYLQDLNIPTDNYRSDYGLPATSETVSCVLNGCPC